MPLDEASAVPVLGKLYAYALGELPRLVKLDPGVVVGEAPEDVEAGREVHPPKLALLQDPLQGELAHHLAHVLQKLAHGHLFARELLHPGVLPEGLHGGADGAHEEVRPPDALVPELGEPLPHPLLNLPLHLGIEAHPSVVRLRQTM